MKQSILSFFVTVIAALFSYDIVVASVVDTEVLFNENELEEVSTAAKFKELMEGLMKGAFQKEFPDAQNCFKDGLTIIKTLEVSIDDIKKGTKKSVEEGIKLIGDIVQKAARKEIVECETAVKEFDELINMAELVSHPLSFLYHAGHNIVVNHVEIEHEVGAAIEAWDEEPRDFYSVGFNIGEALEQVFIGKESNEELYQKLEKFSKADFKELMKGMMRGAFQKEFPDAQSCFKDGFIIIKNLEVAIDDIKEGTTKSVEEGIKLIGDIVQKAARKEIAECETAVKEFDELINMAKLASHPLSFLYHAGHNIVVNHVEIEHEVGAAIEAWDEEPKDFYSVGLNIGEALEQVFIGEETKEDLNEELEKFSKTDFKELMKGLMKGAFQKEFLDIENCLQDGITIIKSLEVAIDDIKQWTKESVEEGIKLIGDIIQKAAGEEIVECETVVKEFDELINMAKLVSHPLSFLYHVGHNILINHVDIQHEISAAIESWDKEPKDFYSIGFNIGEALEQVFIKYENELISVAQK